MQEVKACDNKSTQVSVCLQYEGAIDRTLDYTRMYMYFPYQRVLAVFLEEVCLLASLFSHC